MPGARGPALYPAGDVTCEGYVAYDPAFAGRRPVVILAHAWDGLNDHMRQRAEDYASQGYLAFALDAYGQGKRGDIAGDNSALMAPLMADRALLRARLLAALGFIRAHPMADPDHVAALGWCFGGLCVLDLARSGAPGLHGVVSLHGVFAPTGLPRQRITAQVLVLHGWEDPMAPPADVVALAAELTAAGADWRLVGYGHAMHSFTNPGAAAPERGIAYDPKAAKRSAAAVRDFLAEVFEQAG